jgi:hypothetical protein
MDRQTKVNHLTIHPRSIANTSNIIELGDMLLCISVSTEMFIEDASCIVNGYSMG